MTDTKQLYTIANDLLRTAQLELDECRTHVGEFSRDSWLACMITSRVLARISSALIAVVKEEENAQTEATCPQFQLPSDASPRGRVSPGDQITMLDSEGSDPSAA